MKSPGLFPALAALGLWLPIPAARASYSEPASPPISRTPPVYRLPGKPHPTLDELVRVLEESSVLDPDDADIWFRLGLAYAEKQAPDKAVAALQTAVRLDPRHSEAWFNLGVNLRSQGKLSEAHRAFLKAVEANPRDGSNWNGAALSSLQLKNFKECDAELSKGFAASPDFPALWNSLGNLRLEENKLPEALAAFARAVEIDPRYAIGWINLGQVQEKMKKMDEAILSERQAVKFAPERPEGWANLGFFYYEKNRMKEAAEAMSHSLRLSPGHLDLWNYLGFAQYLLGRWTEAEESFSKGADYSETKDGSFVGAYGVTEAHLGHFEAAGKIFRPALEREPDNALLWANFGECRAIQNRWVEASMAYEKALKLDPGNTLALVGMAMYKMHESKPGEALPLIRKAIEIAPTFEKAWECLAETYAALKRPADAVAAYETMTRRFPGNIHGWIGLANLLDDPEKAESAARHAVSVDPHNLQALEILATRLSAAKRWAQVEDTYRKILAESDADPKAWSRLGYALFQQKKYEESIPPLEKAIDLGSNLSSRDLAIIWENIGLSRMHLASSGGKAALEAAVAAFDKATSLDPRPAAYWFYLARCEHLLGRRDKEETALAILKALAYDKSTDMSALPIPSPPAGAAKGDTLAAGRASLKSGRFLEALPLLWQNYQQKPDDLRLEGETIEALLHTQRFATALKLARHSTAVHAGEAASWAYLGRTYGFMKRYPEGEAALKKSSELKPEAGASWFMLGQCFLAEKKYSQAADAFGKAAGLMPRQFHVWAQLTLCYMPDNDFAGCQAHIESILREHPDSAEGWVDYAVMQIGQHLNDDALATVRKAISLKPSDTDAWGEIGLILSRFNRLDEAIGAFKKALEINPQNQDARTRLIAVYKKQAQWPLAKAACDELAKTDPDLAAKLGKDIPPPPWRLTNP